VATWLAEHVPPDGDAAVIHNDYKYDNLVLDPERLGNIRAVLDWELATLGDPLADLGTTLGYWIDSDDPEELVVIGLGLTTLPGNLNREGVLQRYAQKSGRDVSGMLFHYVSSTFKIAVIAQQIYFRFKQGFTTDERFATMIVGVQLLSKQAARAIELGRIFRLG
jgi:aminoglycoside phosphotransferase (APT) family kinase protein